VGTPWCVQIVGRLHILLRKELLCGRHVLACGERSCKNRRMLSSRNSFHLHGNGSRQ
jgi:hypothetical protein